jgi:HlyD family secretion protein
MSKLLQQFPDIDAMVAWKLDRVSRSLLDFSRLLEVAERDGVDIVSCTEQLDTTTAMGRAFAQLVALFAEMVKGRPWTKETLRPLGGSEGVGVTVQEETFSADRVLSRASLRLAVVERGDLVREVMAQGRVVVANSPTLFSPEQGYVELKVKAGDAVTEGQLLAVVSSADLLELLAREQAQLSRLQADLAQQKIESEQSQLQLQQSLAMAKVELKAHQREMRRADKSFALRLISEFNHERQRDDLERAELEYHQAEQNLALSKNSMEFYDRSLQLQAESQKLIIQALERRIDELNIRSPVNGMVGNIEVNQKQVVAAHQPLITVVDLSTYENESSVTEGQAN